MIYKCPACAGPLKYDVDSDKMVCEYCGSTYEVSDIEQPQVKEDKYTAPDDNYMEFNVYCCSACGGELMVNGLETSTFCSYCGQPTIVFDRVSKELKPRYILPFAVTKEEAMQILRDRLNKGAFVPEEIKHFEADHVRGIYMPFWLSDMDYEARAIIESTHGSGKNKTHHTYYRHAKTKFENITLDASERFEDETSLRLEPYDLTQMVPFDAAYMSGYYADRYDVQKADSTKLAKKRAKELFQSALEDTVGGHDKKFKEYSEKCKVTDVKYAMLPVWFLTFRYQDKPLTFLINGQTSKIIGGVPFKKQKVYPIIVALAIALSVLFTAISWGLMRDAEEPGRWFTYALFIGIGILIAGISRFKAVQRSIERSSSSVMLKMVKEREEEQ